MLNVQKTKDLAQKYNWDFLEHQENIKMISFVCKDERVNVYYSTGTVGTCINHPKKGKTQMYRRNVTSRQLEAIFKKPRVHTGKGYQKKTGSKEKSEKEATIKDLWAMITDHREEIMELEKHNHKLWRELQKYKKKFGDKKSWWRKLF